MNNVTKIMLTPTGFSSPFGCFFTKPEAAEVYRQVGRNDLMKHLEINETEAAELQNLEINFNYWWTGKDHENCKKWTFDGCDYYSDFSIRNFFLASICDLVRGATLNNHLDIVNKIKAIKGLHKWLHFAENRVTIKDMYFGKWKNNWMF